MLKKFIAKHGKAMLGTVIAIVIALSVFPTVIFADTENPIGLQSAIENGRDARKNQVRVIVENNTYTDKEENNWSWYGKLVDEWVDIDEDSTMMSCIVSALNKKGYSQEGAENNYISEIAGLAAFDGGPMSGWMGTLNDWFTNEGFGNFTVRNGKLSAGDIINIVYTCDYGEDCGGSWSNSDTTVKNVVLSSGTLNTAFDKDTHDYTVNVWNYISSLKVTPTASNKNYQARIFVGGTEYKRTALIPVENGTVITVKCADPSWPSMNTSEAAQVYTFTVAKVIPAVTYSITVKAAPSTVNLTFTDSNNNVVNAVDNGVVSKYHQYTLTVPAGTYSYRGTDGVVNIGGDSFTVSEQSAITVIRDNIRYNGASLSADGDYTFTLKNGEKDVVFGDSYISSGMKYTPSLLIAGVAYNGNVTIDSKWDYDYYLSNNGNFTVNLKNTVTTAQTCNLPIASYKILKVTAPKDATVKFYKQEANYVVTDRTSEITETIENSDETKTHIIKSTATHTGYQYRVTCSGEVTHAGYLTDNTPVIVTFDNKVPSDIQSDIAYDDNSILLNIDDSKDTNELSMSVGDTFKLRAWRGAWEIVSSTTANQMIEPDMHFSILSGGDVVSIEATNTSSKGETYCSGNASGNWMNITALKEGTAIVAVWYDAIKITGAIPEGFFGASDPTRYGVFVVNVGADTTVALNPQSSDGDWDSEFDTVYYLGDNGIFTIKPEGVTTVGVQNVYGTTLGSIQSVTANVDGTYSVPVKDGANIIYAATENGIDYFVVRAKKITYTVKNNTTEETAQNAFPTITTGDSVTLTLNGLNMPVPKMSGIYNPGYMGTAKILYKINNSAALLSSGTQYDFVSSENGSSITFTAYIAGENSLDGFISLSSMGDDFGNHRNTTDEGRAVNMNASEKFGQFGILPSISFNVSDNGTKPTYEESTNLETLSVIGGASSFMNAFSFSNMNAAGKVTEAVKANDAVTWTKANSAMATYTLQVKATTTSYMNTIKLKYWFDGEEAKTVDLTGGVSTVVANPGFDNTKIFNIEILVTPLDSSLGGTKTYSYVVYPGGDNGSTSLKFIHPIITGITFTDSDSNPISLTEAVSYTKTSYTLNVGNTDSLNISASMLTKYKNTTAMTQDNSDKTEIILKSNGEQVGQTVVADAGSSYPTQSWSYSNLDISNADTMIIKVTSYVNEASYREYRVNLKRPEPVYEIGDINKDGLINSTDAALVYAYHNGKSDFTEDELTRADVNGDGKVNSTDAALIYAYHNGKITEFPTKE